MLLDNIILTYVIIMHILTHCVNYAIFCPNKINYVINSEKIKL